MIGYNIKEMGMTKEEILLEEINALESEIEQLRDENLGLRAELSSLKENTRKPDEAKAMIAEMLIAEVGKATKKFPIWPTDPLHAVAILNEEVGELNQAILQTIYEPEKSDKYDVRDEAIQAGAMLIRFMMSLDKYNYSCSIQHEQEVPKQSSEGEEG